MVLFKKDFWSYFGSSFKKSKWIIVRHIVIALYLTVSSIIANKMNLTNLTYFNSVFGLTYFSELIAFGIANGIGVYINHNIENKNKVNNYIKTGLYLHIISSFIWVVLLAVLYKPLLHGLLYLPQTIDYTFYFLMLIYCFLVSILTYIVNILKELEIFFGELLLAIIQSILIILGFFLALWAFDLSLYFIAFSYIFAAICAIIFGFIYLYKKININLLKPTKLSLTKTEFFTIVKMTLTQFVWQIGYTFLSYFILKSSEIIFNQYAYFENVLDILNGFYFSFVVVTSIDIARSLGENNFKETYKIAKYSLWATFVIWAIYFIISVSISIPLINGMSIDIQENAFICLILYLFIYLFRFLSWNLMSYILCRGGEVKLIFWQELCCSIYLVALYFIAGFIPSNIFLIFSLVALPTIFQTILGLIMFKRKKWMKNLNHSSPTIN